MFVLSALNDLSAVLTSEERSYLDNRERALSESSRNARGESSRSDSNLSISTQFHFDIERDEDFQNIINNELSSSDDDVHPPDSSSLLRASIGIFGESNELTSNYILSKLYNYMKISEMSKYGISVFEITFSSYLSYLSECALSKLATSYWCNGAHFKCMISHRSDVIRGGAVLKLSITDELLDAAMESGASMCKIEAMLLQKRIDDCVQIKKGLNTKCERKFYLRNLKHRFWNHELLVSVFTRNGWLNRDLAQSAMKSFVETVYNRVLRSKLGFVFNENNGENLDQNEMQFLHSFFVSYFDLDSIPKIYKKQQIYDNDAHQIREEVLRRWCRLVELLASRGAYINKDVFRKVIPLQYAFMIGHNTHKIISSPHHIKNTQLLPFHYQQNITIPDDIWDLTVEYL